MTTHFQNSGSDAYTRHKAYQRDYVEAYGSRASTSANDIKRTDFDVLKESYKLIRDDIDPSGISWEEKLAVKYEDSLYKEYGVCDLKHYKSGNVAIRWRTEAEVLSGAGQSTCANTRCAYHPPRAPHERPPPPLQALEVPFAYAERGEQKSALIKLVLCERCTRKLTWKRDREKELTVPLREEGQSHLKTDASEPHLAGRPDDIRKEADVYSRRQRRDRSRSRNPRRSAPESLPARRSASPPRRKPRPPPDHGTP